MIVAGIDAHATYLVVAIVSNDGGLIQKPLRIQNTEAARRLELLETHQVSDVVVEASPAWPWLFDLLDDGDGRFVLAHPKKLRAIAEATYKSDEIDATLLARMRLARLIPEVYPKPIEQREQATLVRHRARLSRLRSQAASRIHAELHSVGLHLPRGFLLTGAGRAWLHGLAPLRARATSARPIPRTPRRRAQAQNQGPRPPHRTGRPGDRRRGPASDRAQHRALPGASHRHRESCVQLTEAAL